MWRRLTLFVLLPLLLLLLLTGGLYVFRLDVAAVVLKQQLAARGVADPELQVTALELDSATIEAIRLGEDQEVRIGHLGLEYRWRELGQGRLRAIAIDKAILKLDLTGEKPPLGSLQALVETLTPEAQERAEEDAREEDGAGPPIPPISFTGGRIEAATPEGPLTLDASGVLELTEDGRMEVTAQVSGKGPPGRAEGKLEVELVDGRPLRLVADLVLGDFALPMVAARSAQLHLDATEQTLALDLDLKTAKGSAVLSFLAESGRPILEILPQLAGPTPLDALEEQAMTVQGALTLADFELPSKVSGAEADLVFDLALRDGTLQLELPDPAELSAEGLSDELLRQLDLPTELRAALAAPFSLRLAQKTPQPAAMTVRRSEGGYAVETNLDLRLRSDKGPVLATDLAGDLAFSTAGELLSAHFAEAGIAGENITVADTKLRNAEYRGSLDYAEGRLRAEGRLAAQADAFQTGGVMLQDLALELPAKMQSTLENATLAWEQPASLTTGGFGGLPLETPDGGLTVTSERGQVELDWRDGFAFHHDLEMTVAPGETEIGGVSVRAAPLSLQLTGGSGKDGVYRIEASGESESLTLPGYELRANGLSLEGTLAGREGGFTLRIARLADLRDPQILPLLAVTVEAEPTEGGIALDISASGAGNRLKANAAVRLDTETGSGSASFKLAPLLFVPGALQPVDVLPLLSGLTEVQAEMRSEGKLAWNRNGLTSSSAEIRLDNASMTTGAGRVEGLTTAIQLTSLWPPVSAPGQELTARSYTTSDIPFTDLAATYRLVEGEGAFPDTLPLLLVEHAEMRFGRGLFEVSEVLIDPLGDRQTATIDVKGLELKDLFDLADMKDVTGEGALSGSIPFSIAGDDIVIEDGHLASTGPGMLKIRSAEAKAALKGTGDYVDLMLQALENFRYERLSIAINKPAEGESLLQLKVLGSNPDVLDGHPFDINLNLETDLGPLLEALTAGGQLSRDLMEKIRRQRQGEGQE